MANPLTFKKYGDFRYMYQSKTEMWCIEFPGGRYKESPRQLKHKTEAEVLVYIDDLEAKINRKTED